MNKSHQLLLLLCALPLLLCAAPVEEKILFTIQDKPAEFQLPGTNNHIVKAPGQHPGQALQVVYPKYEEGNSKWPTVYFKAPNFTPTDLAGWDGFVFTVYNPTEDRVDLGLSLNGSNDRSRHFGKHVMLQPNAWNHFLLPVEEFAPIVGETLLHFDFFMTTPAQEYTLYYDDVKLVKRNPPDETILPATVTIADFEEAALPPHFETNGVTYELTDAWAHTGKQSVLLKYKTHRTGEPPWPSFQFYASADPTVSFDWSAFSQFTFAVNYAGNMVLPLRLYLRDAAARTYTQDCMVNPGVETVFTIDLTATGLDLRNVQQCDLYLSRPFADFEVYVDSFQLSTGAVGLEKTESTLDRLMASCELASPALQETLRPQLKKLAADLAKARQTLANPSNTMRDLRQMATLQSRLQDWVSQNARELEEAQLCDRTAKIFPKAPFGIAIADSMVKVMIHDLPLEYVECRTEVSLELAQNEAESLQVVAIGRPDAQTVKAAVEVTPLTNGETTLAPDSTSVALVGHVKCERPPYLASYQGWYPDPLLDFQTEAPVAPHEAISFWVKVKTSADTAPGEYHATITVKAEGETVAEIPLSVTVHDFALPNACPIDLATSFRDHIKQVWNPKMTKAEHDELLEKIAEKMAEYKISLDQIYRRTTYGHPERLDIPVEILKKQRDNGQLRSFCIVNFDTPRDCVSPDDPRVQECIDSTLADLDYWVPILKAEGLYDYAYAYGYDEYTPNYFPLIEKVYAALKAKYPELPFATTAYDHSFGTASPLKSVDIFTPLTPRYNEEVVKQSRAEGHKIWWYICIGPHHPYANWFIEYPAIEARLLMGVMTAKYRPEGFLYYALTRWPENRQPIDGGPYTNWNPASFETANGDGSIFCAGPDGLLGTIRAENFRDGLEDYCYVLELEKRLAAKETSAAPELLRKARALLEIPDTLVHSLETYSHNPNELREYRSLLLQAIDSLK